MKLVRYKYICDMSDITPEINIIEAYTYILGLLTYLLTHSLICSHNALVSYMKLLPGFQPVIKETFPPKKFNIYEINDYHKNLIYFDLD